MQVLAGIIATMALKLPMSFLTFLESLSFFEIDIPFDCYIKYDFYLRLM
jgi:hypothetical protein